MIKGGPIVYKMLGIDKSGGFGTYSGGLGGAPKGSKVHRGGMNPLVYKRNFYCPGDNQTKIVKPHVCDIPLDDSYWSRPHYVGHLKGYFWNLFVIGPEHDDATAGGIINDMAKNFRFKAPRGLRGNLAFKTKAGLYGGYYNTPEFGALYYDPKGGFFNNGGDLINDLGLHN